MMRGVLRLIGAAVVALAMLAGGARAASAGIYTVHSCAGDSASIFTHSSGTAGMQTAEDCTNGGLGLELTAPGGASRGGHADWTTITPDPSVRIVGVTTGGLTDCNLHRDGFTADYFYGDNGVNYGAPQITVDCHGGTGDADAGVLSQAIPSSRYFGVQASCTASNCTVSGFYNLVFAMEGVTLQAQENNGPTLTPTGSNPLPGPAQFNLASVSGWVRGSFPAGFDASDPSGVCEADTTINGKVIADYAERARDYTSWTQCHSTGLSQTVDTTGYRDGPSTLSLQYEASNAAGVSSTITRSVNVDNQQPTVSLSGPTDAPSTAGAQHVTATATAGPSGVDGISCSVDGAPARWYVGASAQIAVSGIGTHEVQCTSQSEAVNASGIHARSAPASLSMRIGVPTVAAVAFSKVVNKLRCHKAVRRVRVRARWVRVRRHGKWVRVRRKAHWVRRRVTRCHPRTVRRRVTRVVTIKRHGTRVRVKRTRVVRVVLEPRRVFKTRRRVGHGHGTTVSGWLGTADGVALAGQSVDVLTAADNGRHNYHVAATATTRADGSWSARLPAGPSRLVSAAYAGSSITEAALAAPVHLIVPARVQLLSVWPRRVPWGGLVHLRGRLRGGYLPPGGALVRLRIGQGSAVTTYGVKTHVRGNGRFGTVYRFGQGQPSLHRSFWFEIASLPMGDYPYAPANSHKRYVTVGGHPHPGHR